MYAQVLANTMEAFNCEASGSTPRKFTDMTPKEELAIYLSFLSLPETAQILPYVKLLAAEELKKAIPHIFSVVWNGYTREERCRYLESIINELQTTKSIDMFNTMAEVIGEISSLTLVENTQTWHECKDVMQMCLDIENLKIQTAGLKIIYHSPHIFGKETEENIGITMKFIELCCKTPELELTALASFNKFYIAHRNNRSVARHMKSLLDSTVLKHVDQLQRNGYTPEKFKLFAELSLENPRLFESHTKKLFDIVVKITQNKTIKTFDRLTALEVLTLYCYVDQDGITGNSEIMNCYVEACLLFVAEVRDADYIWIESTEENDETEEYSIVAMSSLQQISRKMNEKKMSRCVLSVCSHYLENEDWRLVHAAARVINDFPHLCLSSSLEEYISKFSILTKHENARVRFMTCSGIGKLCLHFGSRLSEPSLKLIFETLTHAMKTLVDHRVAYQAAVSLINFFHSIPHEVIENNLRFYIYRLVTIFDFAFDEVTEECTRKVVNAVLLAIGQLALRAGSFVTEHFKIVNDVMVKSMEKAASEMYVDLFAHTIESVSALGKSVGENLIKKTVKEILKISAHFLKKVEVIGAYFRRIITSLQALNSTINPGTISRSLINYLLVAAADEYKGNNVLRIKNNETDDKEYSIRALLNIVKQLKERAEPFRVEFVDLIRKNLKMVSHVGVLCSTADLMAALISTTGKLDEKLAMGTQFISDIRDAIQKVEDAACSNILFNILQPVLTSCPSIGLTAENSDRLLEISCLRLRSFYSRATFLNERLSKKNCVDVESPDQLKIHMAHLSATSDFLKWLLARVNTVDSSRISSIMETLSSLFQLTNTDDEEKLFIEILSDVIDLFDRKDHISFRVTDVMGIVNEMLEEPSSKLKKEGLGLIMRISRRSPYSPLFGNANLKYLQFLVELIEGGEWKRIRNYKVVREIAVRTVVHLLCLSDESQPQILEVKQKFIEWLPINLNEPNNANTYYYFATKYLKGYEMFYNEGNVMLPKILKTAVTAVCTELVQDTSKTNELKTNLAFMVVNIRKLNTETSFNKLVDAADLNDRERHSLEIIFESHVESPDEEQAEH